jgi:Rrf2 family nitric oxide-sensitive transcriptional repressor
VKCKNITRYNASFAVKSNRVFAMQLNQQTDYALRVLMLLAQAEKLDKPKLYTIREIAEYHQISRHHLMKVVNGLVGLGFVRAHRGRCGGLELGKPSTHIVLGDVVRGVENSWNLVACFSPAENSACRIQDRCRLQHVFHQALCAFWSKLDEFTLADISAPQVQIEPKPAIWPQGCQAEY